MKIFAIWDKQVQKDLPIGYLFCYEKTNKYVIELQQNLDEWDAPLLFQKYVHENKFTILNDIASLWIKERLIPSGRQNIGLILKEAKLKEYNETALLSLSSGKCSQDSCYLKEIKHEELPEHIVMRTTMNLTECFYAGHQNIVCLFKDNLVRKISLNKLVQDFKKLSPLLAHEQLLQTVKIDAGGYSISFHDSIEIPVFALRDKKYEEPITAEDFTAFVQNNLVDTSKACEKIQCSRQNISYLVNIGKLTPIIDYAKEKIFTKGSIERAINEQF